MTFARFDWTDVPTNVGHSEASVDQRFSFHSTLLQRRVPFPLNDPLRGLKDRAHQPLDTTSLIDSPTCGQRLGALHVIPLCSAVVNEGASYVEGGIEKGRVARG